MELFLSTLTSLILAKYYTNSNCIYLITDNDNLINLNTTIPIVNLKIDNNNLQNNIFRNGYGCFGFLLKANELCELFSNIEHTMRQTDEKFNERKYLVLPSNNYYVDNIKCIFESREIEFVDDILLIVPSVSNDTNFLNETSNLFGEKDEYDEANEFNNTSTFNEANQLISEINGNFVMFDLITHKYVGDFHNETVLLDKWYSNNQTFRFNNDLYPDKLTNQQGRALRVATFTYPPYAVPAIMDGTELRMTNLFAKLYNATTELIVDEPKQWGTIYDNWTGIGVVGNVAIDEADIGLGALYTWQRESLFLDLSKNFVRTGITCLTPIPRLADGWLTPVLAFSHLLWIAVGITFVLVILSFFFTTLIVKKYKLDEHYINKANGMLMMESIFKALSIFFTQSVPTKQIPKNQLFNGIFGMVLIIAVLLTTCYSSGLSSNMTVPRYVGEIKTVRDLVDSKLHWGATDFAWVASIANDSDPEMSTLFHRFEILSEAKLNAHAQTNKFAFSIERLSGGNYAIGEYIGKNEIKHMKPMREDIYYEHCVFMLKKSSILLPLLNDLILKIFEAGLLQYWEYNVVMKTMDTYVQRVVRYSFHHVDSSEPIELKLNHLAGGFGVLVCGLLLSLIIFLFEYFGHKL